MNLQVGDIIKLEDNQFVAVSKLQEIAIFNCLRFILGDTDTAEIALFAFYQHWGFNIVLHTGRHPPSLQQWALWAVLHWDRRAGRVSAAVVI